MSIFDIIKKKENNRWEKYYTKAEWNINVPDVSIYNYMSNKANNYLDTIAFNYFGKTIKYKELLKQIDLKKEAIKKVDEMRSKIKDGKLENKEKQVIMKKTLF